MVTPVPARHPATLALQVASVAAVSAGRLVLGVGSGDPEGDPGIGTGSRGERLDAGLEEVRKACPDVPVWVGGALTKPAPRARALRWDGACLYRVPPPAWEDLTPDDVAGLRADAGRRPGATPYVVAVGGRERREDLSVERQYVASLAEAGADWWHEYVPPRLDRAEAHRRIVAGPIVA